MKKILCIVLTVFMLMSMFSVVSFAAERQPTIEKVEMLDSYPISKAELEEMYLPNYPDYAEATDKLELYYSYFEYKFKVTLSDGTSVEFEPYYNNYKIYEIDEDTKLYVSAYMLEGELANAVNSGAEEVPVYVECLTYQSSLEGIINFNKIESYRTGYVATFEKPLVEKYVVSFEPVEEFGSVYEDAEYYDITDKEFNVEYYDGTKSTYTVENIGLSSTKSEFQLNGSQVFSFINYLGYGDEDVEDGEAMVRVDYLDYYYKTTVEEKENPYKAIKLTDYKLEEGVGVTSVSFDITKKDGTTKSYTVDTKPFINEKWEKYLPSGTILAVDGYYVNLASDVYGTLEESELIISLYMTYDIEDYISAEVPEWLANEFLGDGSIAGTSFLARIIAAIANFFRAIISFFS